MIINYKVPAEEDAAAAAADDDEEQPEVRWCKILLSGKTEPRGCGGVNIYEDPTIQFLICRLSSSGVMSFTRFVAIIFQRRMKPPSFKTSAGLKWRRWVRATEIAIPGGDDPERVRWAPLSCHPETHSRNFTVTLV